ncbi:Dyp-type peroxidase [Streptomyces tsukubensis]
MPVQIRSTEPEERVLLITYNRGIGDPRHLLTGIRAAEGPGVTVGVALGASAFLRTADRPRQLVTMPSFAGDLLDSGSSHGDILIQVAGERDRDLRAAVERLQTAGPQWRVRWQIEGFRPKTQMKNGKALSQNPFHFTEGFGNPAGLKATRDRTLVRADQGEPEWAIGGSYQVVRIIRFATEFWDRDSVTKQEQIIGRRRNGRWLDGTPPDEEPNFAADPEGQLTPLDSHVRLAAPDRRNPPHIVRRSYSYTRGSGDTGLIFSCFQRDLAEGFEAVQGRLASEAMAKYLLTTGGGYFFVPPPGNNWVNALTPV